MIESMLAPCYSSGVASCYTQKRTGALIMEHIVLEWATIEVIVTAYNSGILAYGAMTLRDGQIKVSLDIRSRFNILTVELAHGPFNTLTLWDADNNHDDIIRLHFGEEVN